MTIKKIDKSQMRKVILDFPKQFEEALEFSKDIKIKGEFENIIVCGLGGSALPANLLICWLNDLILKSRLSIPPIYTHRDYNLPSQTEKKSLVICVSYSGNTEETISALKTAVSRKLKITAITTGGKIANLCKENNISWIKIPVTGIQPRSATGYIFTSLVNLLVGAKIIPNKSKEILELTKKLKKLNQEKEAKKIAKKLVNKIPIVYTSNRFKSLARIWKIIFNENSKIPAFFNYFPELNHNEMVGFTQTKNNNNFHIIILRDNNDHKRNIKRMKLFASLMEAKGIKVDFIDIKKGSVLFKIFSTLLLGNWISYYLALEYKIDPSPVKIVEEFKKKME